MLNIYVPLYSCIHVELSGKRRFLNNFIKEFANGHEK